MKFSEIWNPRVLQLIFFFTTEIIFNCGTTCARRYEQTKRNSSESQNFFTDYVGLVFNKSKELEEIIYSDLLNNLKSLVRIQNTKTESVNDYSKHDRNVKTEKIEYGHRNKSRILHHSFAPIYNVLISGMKDQKVNELTFKNFTHSAFREIPTDKYLVGYSGNPFGSRKVTAGVTETPGYDQSERIIIDPRKKRSVLHLYNMVLCSTGCNPFLYKGYGCYCGFLGSGFVVDGIDSCCKMHDWCYNSAGCPMFLEYFIPYLWKCYHHQPLCAVDYEYYGTPASCSQRLCECDRQLALCLRRYPCPTTKALCTSSPWRLLQNILML